MEDGLQLDMECDGHPRPLEKYIEAWWIQLWEHGFLDFFKGKESYSKTTAFEEYKHTDLAIKLVIFRYFCPLGSQAFSFFNPTPCGIQCLHFSSKYFTRKLYPLDASQKADHPFYLSTWLLKSFLHCNDASM